MSTTVDVGDLAPQSRELLEALAHGASLEDLGWALGHPPDRVDALARAALIELDPAGARELSPARRAAVGDYVLRRQRPGQAAGTFRALQEDPAAHRWAAALREALAPVQPGDGPPLPRGADDRFDVRAYRGTGSAPEADADEVRPAGPQEGRPVVERLLEPAQSESPDRLDESKLSLPETLESLRRYLGDSTWRVGAGVGLLVVSAVIGLLQPLAARFIIKRLTLGESLTWSIVALIVLVVIAALALGCGSYLLLRSAETIIATGRRRLTDRIIQMTMNAMRHQAPGDLMSRVTADTSMLRQIAIQSLTSAVLGSVTLAGALIAMGTVDLFLLAVVAGVVVLLGVTMSQLMPRIKSASSEGQEAVGALGSELERAIDGFILVKASGSEQIELDRIRKAIDDAERSGGRLARWTALGSSGSGVSTNVTFLVVLGVGGARVQAGHLTIADLTAFLLYVFYLNAPTLQLINASTSFQAGRAALGRIAAVEQLPVEVEVREDVTPSSHDWDPPAGVRFERVQFTYDGKQDPALRDFDVELPAGGLTALVGPSGAGKSTIFALLERFYLPDSGRIMLDDRDLSAWPLSDLRASTAYVQQDTPVVAGSLRENLTYAAPAANDEEIMAALELCRLGPMLERLDADLDAPLSKHGGSISGGERQRVAMARALLRRPRLLLLDEVTSQLDAANEAALRDVVTDVSRHTTVIVAAHRLSTIRGADRILVIEDARLRAMGRHDELIETDELYRSFASVQQRDGDA